MTATGSLEESLFIDIDTIDLEKYRYHKHEIRNPLHYRESLVQHFLSDPNKHGAILPWESGSELKFRQGELTCWSGQNFHGKSAVMTQTLLNFMREGRSSREEKVLLISPEFSPELNLARIVQQVVGKPAGQITEADVTAVMVWLEPRFLIYDAVGSVDIEDLIAVIYWAGDQHGVTQCAIDNLTVLRLPSGDINQSQANLMTQAVQCARQSGVHIHIVCHTRKPAPGEEVSRYNIRGASQISDLSDNVIAVVRNESKEKKLADIKLDEEDRKEIRRQSDTKIYVLKQRHGTAWIGNIKLYYDPLSMRWSEKMNIVPRPFAEVTELAQLGGPMRSPQH